MDKISVCMATRNGEKYLIKQLESILIQIDQDDEVIISDDSSTDRTVEVIKYLKDSRIRLLENNTYLNPIFNFENALRQATGEIIALSDQDDIWLNNKTAVIRREFKDHHAGIKLIVLDGLIVDENENILYDSIFDKMRSGRGGLMKNIYANTYMGCCMAFSRDLTTDQTRASRGAVQAHPQLPPTRGIAARYFFGDRAISTFSFSASFSNAPSKQLLTLKCPPQ